MEKKQEKIKDYTYFWDIETSTITTDCGYEMQVTYLSNVVKMDCNNGEIIYSKFFRTIRETIEYFETLENCIVWCHNLDYELTFLLRETQANGEKGDINVMYNKESQNIILRDKNAPLSITLDELPNINFRDSYALFNKSVKALGDELDLPKLDYDYKVIRLPWDCLTQLDYDYNERDNIIVAKSIYKYMKNNNLNVNEIPLTFTSSVRRARKQFIKENYGKKALNKFYFDRNNSFLEFGFIEDLMKVYQGGLTASNILETAKIINNKNTSGVIGVDIKSSYPSQMCTKKFPIFTNENTTLYDDLANNEYKNGRYKGFIGFFTFTNIRVKNKKYLLPISSSQLSKGQVEGKREFFNGKLLSADKITLPCTNVDIDVINMVYDYDEIYCNKIRTALKEQYLRKEEVAFLLTNFINKETKSGDIKANSKLIINSMYGVKVSNPIKDNYEIIEGNVFVDEYFNYNEEDREKIYNNYVNSLEEYGGSIDVYSDGVFITSYARHQLISMVVFIVSEGGSVVYSDTDSIKFYCKNKKEMNKLIKKITSKNDDKIKENKKLPRFKSYINDFKITENEINIISTLGIWEVEDEDTHKLFITYGAKKYGYITHNGKIKTTIAGCNKKNIPLVIENVARENNISIDESFEFVLSPGTTFDESASGRTTAQKEKLEQVKMIDFTYNNIKIKQFGGIVIKDTTYTLNMTLSDSHIVGCNETDLEMVKINIKGCVEYAE